MRKISSTYNPTPDAARASPIRERKIESIAGNVSPSFSSAARGTPKAPVGGKQTVSKTQSFFGGMSQNFKRLSGNAGKPFKDRKTKAQYNASKLK